MSMFVITLISPTSLFNGKFLERAVAIIVPFNIVYYVWELIPRLGCSIGKSIMFLKKIYYLVKFIRNQEDSHGSASRDYFF